MKKSRNTRSAVLRKKGRAAAAAKIKRNAKKKAKPRRPPIYQWKDDLSLNMAKIDTQHKRWFAMTNAFLKKVRAGKADIETVRKTLTLIVGHASRHFRQEEAYMRRLRMPCDYYHWHVMTHNAFVQRINALARKCRRGSPKAIEEMVSFMTGWLTRHIKKCDVQYMKFYLARSPAISLNL